MVNIPMIQTVDKSNDVATVSIEKDTWILSVPVEICEREGFPAGTLISLTLKNDAVIGEYLKPDPEIDEFVDRVVRQDSEFFEEMKEIGD